MTKKTFVIDTNILLHDPAAITKFPDSCIVIPVTVLEELDKMKRLPNDLGKNARVVFRTLDSLSEEGKGDLHQGVLLDNGSTIRIQLDTKAETTFNFPLNVNDNKIILAAYLLKEKGSRSYFSPKILRLVSKRKRSDWKFRTTKMPSIHMNPSTVGSGN